MYLACSNVEIYMFIDQIAESSVCVCAPKLRLQQREDQADPDCFIFYCFSFILSPYLDPQWRTFG